MAQGLVCFLAKLLPACRADLLVLEDLHALRFTAEDAGRIVFREKDVISLHEDLDGIVVLNIHFATHLLGNNDAPKLVNVTNNSCGFHFESFLLCFYKNIVAEHSTVVNRKLEKITIFVEIFGRKFDKPKEEKREARVNNEARRL